MTTPSEVDTIDEVVEDAALEYIWDVVRPFIREEVVTRKDFIHHASQMLAAQGLTVCDVVRQINNNRDEIIRILRNNGIDI